MRKIAGTGAVSNAFADYDASSNPVGTVFTAEYGNDVQNELMGVQDYAEIDEAAGTNKYILSAIKKISSDFGKQIGELYFLDSLKTASEFDKDSPGDYFNGICLDAIDSYEDISSDNWPDLVTHLRTKALTYNEGVSGAKSSFDVTGWSVASGVATLTFADTEGENAILTALAEDNLVHGDYSNWRSITLSSAIGDISAGEYAITGGNASLRQITFTSTASDNSGTGTYTAIFYTNRVPGSTTTARIYEVTARTLVSSDSQNINGLRMRDAMQRITGGMSGSNISGATSDGVFTGSGERATSSGNSAYGQEYNFNSSSSTYPNAAKTDEEFTRVRSLGSHLYIHGRRYSA